MNKKQIKKNLVLGILFFLPVIFLLFLYPAKHNYNALDIINENVIDLSNFTSNSDETILLKDHLTVLGFFGKNPKEKLTTALNLKEMVYDKFIGFKGFQTVVIVPNSAKEEAEAVKSELTTFETLKYWHFVYADEEEVQKIYNSLFASKPLDSNLATDHVFVIDKDLNQRGRRDDRSDTEIEKNLPEYKKASYDCIEVAELKNIMSEDLRVLFTEYRQKRKGNFDSNSRRKEEIKK